MGKYFGTDGIRGEFGGALINTEFAYRVGVALARYLSPTPSDVPLNIVIGRDTRQSGQALSDALTQGLNSRGVFVHDCAVVPTPAVALAIVELRADLGIAITASHNPSHDNGIKLFNSKGHKLSTNDEAHIETLIDAEVHPGKLPAPKTYPFDGASYYVNYLRSLMDQSCMQNWKVVLDTANGATYKTSPAVFERWGPRLFLIGDQPDGNNINSGVGSEHPLSLGKTVCANEANIGIAHDGDGDRLVVCDETGALVDGDILLGIFGLHALSTGTLKNKTLITTIQSNLGLDAAIRKAGGTVERVDIGDRNVAERMRSTGSNVGGENSGHIIFSDVTMTGDGLLAAIKLIEVMCDTGKPLSELAKSITLCPVKTLNLMVKEKTPLKDLPTLSNAIQTIEDEFGDTGRLLVRYSGTEPKLRILVEADSEVDVLAALNQIEKAARHDLNVIDS